MVESKIATKWLILKWFHHVIEVLLHISGSRFRMKRWYHNLKMGGSVCPDGWRMVWCGGSHLWIELQTGKNGKGKIMRTRPLRFPKPQGSFPIRKRKNRRGLEDLNGYRACRPLGFFLNRNRKNLRRPKDPKGYHIRLKSNKPIWKSKKFSGGQL